LKRTAPNASDAGRNADAGQATATLKRRAPNASDGIRNYDAGQAGATLKRRAPNASDGIGDGDGAGFTCRALDEGGLRFVIKDAICTAIVRVSCIHRNRSQAAAIHKRIESNACDAGRNSDAGQTGHIRKCPEPNGNHRLTKNRAWNYHRTASTRITRDGDATS